MGKLHTLERKDLMMKTTQFVNQLKELEFIKKVDIDSKAGIIRAYDYQNNVLLEVLTKEVHSYNTLFPGFRRLKVDQKDILMKYLIDYSATALSKRTEENKYIVPVIPRSMYLQGKYLYNGRVGLQLRNLTLDQLHSKNIPSGFIFTEHKINRLRANRDIYIKFENNLIKV